MLPALTLSPDSPATRSAWLDLTVSQRSELVTNFLIINPQLRPTGSIDFESPNEPLFIDDDLGSIFTLMAEIVGDADSPETAPAKPSLIDNPIVAGAIVLGVVAVLALG